MGTTMESLIYQNRHGKSEKEKAEEIQANHDNLAKTILGILDAWPQDRLVKKVEETVVGQHEAVEDTVAFLRMALLRSKKLAEGANPKDLPNTCVALIHGPTGSGKTFITETLCAILGVKMVVINSATLTGTGWRGADLASQLARIEEAQSSGSQLVVVFFDEADKIVRGGGTADSSFSVAQDLLKPIEATGIVEYENPNPKEEPIKIDHTGVIYILGGAFEGICEMTRKRLNSQSDAPSMGFGTTSISAARYLTETQLRHMVSGSDFEQWGFMPELLGRIATYVAIDPLSEEAFYQILSGSGSSIEKRINNLVAGSGITFSISEPAKNFIATQARAAKRGARGAQTVVSSVVWPVLSEALSNSFMGQVELIVEDNGLHCKAKKGKPRYYGWVDEDNSAHYEFGEWHAVLEKVKQAHAGKQIPMKRFGSVEEAKAFVAEHGGDQLAEHGGAQGEEKEPVMSAEQKLYYVYLETEGTTGMICDYVSASSWDEVKKKHPTAKRVASKADAENIKNIFLEHYGYTGGSVAFIDGSGRQNQETHKFDAGGFAVLLYKGDNFNLNEEFDTDSDEYYPTCKRSGKAPHDHGQIDGELLAFEVACKEALNLGLSKLTLVFDCDNAFRTYLGLNEPVDQAIKDCLESIDGKLALHFQWQKSHDAVSTFSERANDYVDNMAKYHSGVLTKDALEDKGYGWLIEAD